MFCVFLILVLYGGEFILSVKDGSIFKVIAFERGFKSVSKVQNSFRIHFFVIILIFIIFDLEVVIFLGILVSRSEILLIFLFLIIFVGGGFYIE